MQVAIIGAGAAGCFAAANMPTHPGLGVTVYEKTGKALQKVKVSGGGRCNTTHQLFDIPGLVSRYPRGSRFLRKTFYSFGPEDTIRWFASRGVTLKAEEDGRMFPVTDDSQTIIDCIWQEMMRKKVAVRYHKSVREIQREAGGFTLLFADGSTAPADKVLVACGGYPKPEQFQWLKALGHDFTDPVPSLFTFNLPGHPLNELMGLSVPDAVVRVAGTKIAERGPVLITHWGLSGPAVLRASAWGARELAALNYRFRVLVNWLGETRDEELRGIFEQQRSTQGKSFIFQKNPFQLPRRLWEYFLKEAGAGETTRWGDLSAAVRNKLQELLLRSQYEVTGKTTFKEEFVTCGGISLASINPDTMESRSVPGLYFAGEIMDVDGITGGFNFQHAWTSGWLAAKAIAANMEAVP